MTASPDLNRSPGYESPPSARPRLYRSSTNRVFAGVCAGVADHFGADPTTVRLLAVVIAVFTAIVPMFVLYLVAAIVIPVQVGGVIPAGVTPAAGGLRAGQAGLVFGVLLVAVGILAFANEMFRIEWDLLWPFVLIVLGGMLVFAAQRR